MNSQFRYWRWASLRQLPLAVAIATLGIAATIFAAKVIPPTYTATARLLVESTAVTNGKSNITDSSTSAAHLQNIENRVLTLSRLTRIRDELTLDLTIEDFREAITFETLSGRGKSTTMTVTLAMTDPSLAAKVANRLAEEVLAEHRAIRTERAEAALKFFRQEVDDNKLQLDAQFVRLFNFKSMNAGALPQDAPRYYDQRKALVAQLSLRPAARVTSTAHSRLAADLSAARAIYAEQHPVVQALSAKMTKLGPAQVVAQTDNPLVREELVKIDAALADIPANEVRLDTLQRDYDLAEAQYTSAMQRLEAAAIEERIALRSEGERLSIVERAALPDSPAGPRQKIILAIGCLLAVLVALGVSILRARSDKRVRRPKDLETTMGLMPYAVIPQMKPS